jgi:hypothetical protein
MPWINLIVRRDTFTREVQHEPGTSGLATNCSATACGLYAFLVPP